MATTFSEINNGNQKYAFIILSFENSKHFKEFSEIFDSQGKYNAKLNSHFVSVRLANQIFIFLLNRMK